MRVSIIGCGNIGSKIGKRIHQAHDLMLFDRHPEKVDLLLRDIRGKQAKSLSDTANADAVILAIKPKDLNEVAKECRGSLKGKLVVSTLAGVTVETLEENFPESALLRIMPNIAIEYGKGSIGIVETGDFSEKEKKAIEELLSPLGALHWIPESWIDPFTALAGSGPAFMFVLIEALVESGIAMGIPKDEGIKIVLEMIDGAVTCVRESGKHPAVLKWEVASPGGTTVAGLKTLEDEGVRAGLINTILATYERAREMGE